MEAPSRRISLHQHCYWSTCTGNLSVRKKGGVIVCQKKGGVIMFVISQQKFVWQKKWRCYCLWYHIRLLGQKTREVFVISPVHISMSVSKKGGVIVYDITTSARLSEKGRCYCFQYHHISLSVRKGEVLLFVISPC